jgi:ORF6N domain
VAKLKTPIRVVGITGAILVQRGHRVLLDETLAELYGVETKVLIQAVKRNLARFPPDFMFQLTASEWAGLRSQIVTSTVRRGGRRYPPHAFTEQGVAMLSSVLGSNRAIAVNIQIMRAFVRMREMLITNKELAQKLDQLEARLEKKLASHDEAIAAILSAIRELMNPTPPRRRGIGFTADLEEE